MGEMKTKRTTASVVEFIHSTKNDQRRRDAIETHQLMSEMTGDAGQMYGPSIIGYGSAQLIDAHGRAMDWFIVGFSPRKSSLLFYIGTELDADLLAALGKHKRGIACLYINKIDDIDREVLRSLIARAVDS